MNELSGGLWKKTSKKGLSYYGGSIVINGQKYWVSLFNNTRKETDKHPDLNLMLSVAEQTVGQQNANNVNREFNQPQQVADPYAPDNDIQF